MIHYKEVETPSRNEVLNRLDKGDAHLRSKLSPIYDKIEARINTTELITSKHNGRTLGSEPLTRSFCMFVCARLDGLSQPDHYFQGHKHGKQTDGVTALTTKQNFFFVLFCAITKQELGLRFST